MTDYTGQQWGSYRLVRLLGSGGFADVYLGEGWPGGFVIDYGPANNYGSSVHVWETRTGSSRSICQGTAWVESAAWSPDGNYLVVGYGHGHGIGLVEVWDIAKDRVIAVHRGYVCSGDPGGGVTWSPDGNYLAYTAFSTEIQTYPEVS